MNNPLLKKKKLQGSHIASFVTQAVIRVLLFDVNVIDKELFEIIHHLDENFESKTKTNCSILTRKKL